MLCSVGHLQIKLRYLGDRVDDRSAWSKADHLCVRSAKIIYSYCELAPADRPQSLRRAG